MHSLKLESSEAASGKASEWARRLAGQAGWPEERVYALDLCVVELVSNVVNHGYRGRPGEIRLELDLGQSSARFSIDDDAPAFDPLSVAAPVLAASIEDVPLGGFGIHMVRTAASECRYERREGRNVFTCTIS